MNTLSIGSKRVAFVIGLSFIVLIAVLLLTSSSRGAGTDHNAEQNTAKGSPSSGDEQSFSILKPASPSVYSGALASMEPVISQLPATVANGEDEALDTVSMVGVDPNGSAASQILVTEMKDPASGENKTLCILATGSEYQGATLGSCFSLSEVLAGKGYVAVQGMAKESVRLIGVVPNNVASISLDIDNDGTVDKEAKVSNNIYQVDLPPAQAEVAGFDMSGNMQFEVSLPRADQVG